MSNMAIMCRCVEISLLGCVEQNVVQNTPSLTRFLPIWDFYMSTDRQTQKTQQGNLLTGGTTDFVSELGLTEENM